MTRVTRLGVLLSALIALPATLCAQSRPTIGNGVKHAQASIEALSLTSTRAQVLVTLTVDPGWHVSWRNPGETGLPTRLSWSLPAGVRALNETWPVPVIAHTSVGATHTLEGAVPWLVEFAIDSVAPVDRLITLTLKYGVCRDVCIPEQLSVQGVLPGGRGVVRTVVSPALRARLSVNRGAIAARRRSPTELCLDRVPLTTTAPWPEVIADSGLALDAAMKLTPSSPSRSHGFVMNVPKDAVLRDGAKILVVQGNSGVAAVLDFHRAAPGCAPH
jgi:Disulphide bond corrector protein DsbC